MYILQSHSYGKLAFSFSEVIFASSEWEGLCTHVNVTLLAHPLDLKHNRCWKQTQKQNIQQKWHIHEKAQHP